MRNANWCSRGVVRHLAFLLRPASALFPAEEELSLGRTAASAVDELNEHHGVGELLELAIQELPHNLAIRQDADNELKAYLLGLPVFSTEQAQRDLAMTMATDLALNSKYISPKDM